MHLMVHHGVADMKWPQKGNAVLSPNRSVAQQASLCQGFLNDGQQRVKCEASAALRGKLQAQMLPWAAPGPASPV